MWSFSQDVILQGGMCLTVGLSVLPQHRALLLEGILKCLMPSWPNVKRLLSKFSFKHNRTTLVYVCYFLLQSVWVSCKCANGGNSRTRQKKNTFKAPFEFWKNSMVHINGNLRRRKNRCVISTMHISDILAELAPNFPLVCIWVSVTPPHSVSVHYFISHLMLNCWIWNTTSECLPTSAWRRVVFVSTAVCITFLAVSQMWVSCEILCGINSSSLIT